MKVFVAFARVNNNRRGINLVRFSNRALTLETSHNYEGFRLLLQNPQVGRGIIRYPLATKRIS